AAGTEASEEICVATAERVVELREMRPHLLAAVAGSAVSVEVARLALDELEKAEKSALALFRPSSSKTLDVVCELTPQLADVATEAAANGDLDPVTFTRPLVAVGPKGVCQLDRTNPSSCLAPGSSSRVDCDVPVAFRASEADDATRFTLHLDYVADQVSESLRRGGTPVKARQLDHSFYYRIPAEARVRLTAEKGSKATAVLDRGATFAQLGLIAALPGKGNDQYVIEIHPETGALKKVTASSAAVATGEVTGLIDAVKGLVDADKASDDELTQLERERKILEERKKIAELLEQLSDDAGSDAGSDDS
ncbi:MAG: hypothetical protein MI919_03550, partial [Holophagales bacterium]|nr:hypothetical protein [Holophagales bacterium]